MRKQEGESITQVDNVRESRTFYVNQRGATTTEYLLSFGAPFISGADRLDSPLFHSK